MLLYCVRHGESEFNAQGRIQGQLDVALSPLGLRQGCAVARSLAGEPIEAVFSSPLRRALHTARPLADALGLPIVTDDRLREIHVGVFQGLLHEELAERYPAETARWKSHDPDFRIPGGETRRELMQRGVAALEWIRSFGYARAALVAHGGLLAAAFKGLLRIPAELNPFSLSNGSISRLAWQDQPRLLTLNATDHLHEDGARLPTRGGDL